MEGLQLPTAWSEEEERTIRALMYVRDDLATCPYLRHAGLEMFFGETDHLWEVLTRIDQREFLKRPGCGRKGLNHMLDDLAGLGLTLSMSTDYNLLILEARRRLAERD